MAWIVVDVEADGPAPGLYSMVSLGAVLVGNDLDTTYFGQTAPISDKWDPEAYKAIGVTREEHLSYPKPEVTIPAFAEWLLMLKGFMQNITFVSDNPAFDWQFVNYYLWRYHGSNPFGFSARRIGDLYSGWKGDARKSSEWKSLRKTAHTHHPVDDAKGNAEALLEMRRQGLRMPL